MEGRGQIITRSGYRVGVIALLLGSLITSPQAFAQACQTLQSQVDATPSGGTLNALPCTYRETVTISRPITLDGHGKAVIDGDNVRNRWLWIAADHVTIRGFRMRNASTASQEGAIGTQPGIGWLLIDRNDLGSTANGEQIGIGQTHDSQITNNDIHDGGMSGIGTYLNQRLVVQGNHLHANNAAHTDPWFAAGGIKAIGDTDLQIIDNEVDHNAGPGIWCDIGCDRVLISGNTIHDQPYNPIFYEISSHGEVSNNTISNSAGANVWGCIVVSSSGSTYVHDNVCADSVPLRAQLETRPDRPADAGTDVRIENNRLTRPTPLQATSWWQQDPSGPLVPGKNGNTDLGNVIGSAPTPTIAATPTVTPVPTGMPTATSTPTSTATPVCINVYVRIDGYPEQTVPFCK
jgi:parallel beta-helix repeat protein